MKPGWLRRGSRVIDMVFSYQHFLLQIRVEGKNRRTLPRLAAAFTSPLSEQELPGFPMYIIHFVYFHL
jgi:hypothetical protein